VALTWACLYLLVSCFFFHYWRQYKMQRLKEQVNARHCRNPEKIWKGLERPGKA
jgi:hypothetical protein